MRRSMAAIIGLLLLLEATIAIEVRLTATSSNSGLGTVNSALYPYPHSEHWGSQRSHAEVTALYRSLFASRLANATGVYSVSGAAPGGQDPHAPADIAHYRVETELDGSLVLGTLFMISNPVGRFRASQPGSAAGQGCDLRTLNPVSQTSSFQKCRVATNAGFFDPSNSPATRGTCYGNFVSGGIPVRAPGTQNANFGLLKNGSFVSGYIPLDLIAKKDANGQITSDFETLVSGVVMLVKDGVNFVDVSGTLEDSSTQTTGSMDTFIQVVTARTAIGHDREGKLLLLVVDGTNHGFVRRGIDLVTLADLMISLGAVNAINLDGGGSSTAVKDSSCVNMPTDGCTGPIPSDIFHCERSVSTIVCVSDPEPAEVPLPQPIAAEPQVTPSLPTEPSVITEPYIPIAAPSPIFIPVPSPIPTPITEPEASIPSNRPSGPAVPLTAPTPVSPLDSPAAIPVAWKALVGVSLIFGIISLGLLLLFIAFGRRPPPTNYQALEELSD